MPPVSVVIPAYGRFDLTRACLESLAATTDAGSVEVVLVDNASPDETPREAPVLGKSLFEDDFTYLNMSVNAGFSRACNAGAARARGDFLFFLNNDTTVSENWLQPLLAGFGSGIAAVGPLLVYPKSRGARVGRVQHLGLTHGVDGHIRHLYEYFPARHRVVAKKRRLIGLTGAALLIPRPLFAGAGGFDEDYVNGLEDVDLCCRLLSKGLMFRLAPDSLVEHYTSATAGRFTHTGRNRELFAKRCRHLPMDYHKHLLADGYRMALTPWGELTAALSRERSVELESVADADLEAALLEEPLWEDGWVRRCKLLLEAVATAEDPARAKAQALAALEIGARLRPNLMLYAWLAEALREAGRGEEAVGIGKVLADIRAILADPELVAQAQARLGHAARRAGVHLDGV